MNVLLIQSYLGQNETEGAVLPLGLCFISSVLPEHNVQIFDPNISESPFPELEEKLKDFNPQVAGISLRNIDTTQRRNISYYYESLEPTIRMIKKVNPATKIMVGGAGFSMFAAKIMDRIPEIDFGVYLEGDESVPELLSKLDKPEGVKGIFIRQNGKTIFTGTRPFPDIDKLPVPRRDLIDIEKYNHPVYANIGIQTKRGCSLKCAYCSYPFLNGDKIRIRPVKKIADEIEYLINEFKIKRFMFTDSVFNIPKGHAEEICREIIKRRLRVEWSAWFDVKGFSEEILTLVLEAGCKNISFSPDAASNTSLAALGKSINEQDISRTIRLLKKAQGVRIEFNFFCTPPGQNFIGFLKTLALFLKVNLTFMGRGVANLGWIRIEPETGIYKLAVAEGIISQETELLPETEAELSGLFYSCPATKWYADPVFDFILGMQDKFKPTLKKLLGRNKGKQLSVVSDNYAG